VLTTRGNISRAGSDVFDCHLFPEGSFLERKKLVSLKYFKTMIQDNIFNLQGLVSDPEKELFEPIFTGNDCKVERIVSKGHSTPTGEWYDQEKDEWVILLKGKAIIEFDSGEMLNLESGDYILIPANKRHRVSHTSSEPPCIWLAIHGDIALHNTDD